LPKLTAFIIPKLLTIYIYGPKRLEEMVPGKINSCGEFEAYIKNFSPKNVKGWLVWNADKTACVFTCCFWQRFHRLQLITPNWCDDYYVDISYGEPCGNSYSTHSIPKGQFGNLMERSIPLPYFDATS
jgi:hypothetical protein